MESNTTTDFNTNYSMAGPLKISENATILEEGIIVDPFSNIAENDTIIDDSIIANHLEILENATIMDEGFMAIPSEISDNAAAMEETLTAAPFDISENATIVEEGLRLCPLCQSEIRLFFINFNEKLLMCENTECEYPFGYEDLQFFKENNDASPDEVVNVQSMQPIETPSATCSVVSATAWLDIVKMNRAYESEDSQFDVRSLDRTKQKEIDVEKERESLICKNVEDLKELSRELVKIDDANGEQRIKNEKWIKNLMNIQSMSGISLLKPEEIKTLKKQQPAIGLGELKIDIDTGDANAISLVNIKITNSGDGSDKNTVQ
ncbi:uncharacterized protein ACR2FA_010153 [Aphomia sociella]